MNPRAPALLIALCLTACANTYDPFAFDRSIAPDGAIADTPVTPVDVTTPPLDVNITPDASSPDAPRPDAVVDVPLPPPDVPPPPPDVPPPPPDVPLPPPDVPPPPPDVVVTDAGCRACMAFSAVQFCPGTGSGACLAYAGCSAEGCAVCAPATRGGDACGADVPVITRRGRSRSVFTTCGALDNIDTNCMRTGPDIVVSARVETGGRVALTFTVPAGFNTDGALTLGAVSLSAGGLFVAGGLTMLLIPLRTTPRTTARALNLGRGPGDFGLSLQGTF